jgi:hypothetical protein
MGPAYAPLVFAPVSPGFFCLNLFELNIFGTIIGSCFRYYFKEIMTSIIVLLCVMLYTITFAISGQWYKPDDTFHFDLQYIILPPSI